VKRSLVAVSTLGFGLALAVAVAQREPVALHLSPVYEGAGGGAGGALAESRYLLRAANRGSRAVTLSVKTEGLPEGARVEGLADRVVPPGRERRFDLVVRVPRSDVPASVTPFEWVIGAEGGEKRFPASLFTRKLS
jgi:hypothetical protein